MAIGTGWAEGSWVDAAWVTAGDGAWSQVANATTDPTNIAPTRGGASFVRAPATYITDSWRRIVRRYSD